jgi:hypothetical protein
MEMRRFGKWDLSARLCAVGVSAVKGSSPPSREGREGSRDLIFICSNPSDLNHLLVGRLLVLKAVKGK